MKTAISIPDPVFEAAEETARRLAMSRSQLYTRAIEEFLNVHGREAITERLNEVYADADSSLDPAIQQLQASSIPEEHW